MTPLESELRRIIAEDGPLTVARYMALCLGHPEHGYYTTRDPFGTRGDFITAPEISQMFGELIGLWAAAVWQLLGEPAAIRLIELGPGRGTLMADALRAVTVLPAFRAALRVHLIEISPVLEAAQRQLIGGLGVPVSWHRDFAEVPDGPFILIANEFFDALPVHQAVKAPDGWHERMIGLSENGALAYGVHPDPLRAFEALLPPGIRAAPNGAIYEWHDPLLADEIAVRMMRDRGAALVIDYGHTASGIGGTLQAVRDHAPADPLHGPGETDLTAHVDFAALARTVERAGAHAYFPVEQGVLLRRLGIVERAQALKARATPQQAEAVDAALARLTGDGDAMGHLFKAVAFSHPALTALPGFDT